MTDLRVDLDGLRALGADLRGVAAEFEQANTRSDRIADAVGHDRLRGAVRDFAHGWDDRRADMVESIRSLGEATTAVADQLAGLDGDLARALTDAGTPEGAR